MVNIATIQLFKMQTFDIICVAQLNEVERVIISRMREMT